MRTRLALAVALFVASALRPAWAQAPAQTPPPPCDPSDAQVVCGQRAPEDLVVTPDGRWVVASAYAGGGGLFLIRTSDRTSTLVYPAANAVERLDKKTYSACPGAPDAAFKAKFQTHGLFLLPGANGVHRVFAVVHGARESVEVFELDTRPQAPTVAWIGCAVAPPGVGLNSVRGLPDGGFIATNFLAPGAFGGAAMKAMMSGEKNGELWEWHPGATWQKVPGSEAAGANGLEISDDGRWFYVAAWGSQSFFRLSRGQTPPVREEVALGFRVDNIRWSRDGSILAAGQGGQGPEQASIVVKIDPKTLAVREVVRRPNSPAFGAGTVAIEVGKQYWVGSFRGDRIAIYPQP